MACLPSLLEITALIASLLRREGKQAIISSQEGKQAIKSKEGAIKCCKEKKLLPHLMSGVKVGVDKVAPSLKVNLRIFANIHVTSLTQFLTYLKVK